MEVQKETIALFDQDKEYVIDYLKSREVINQKLDNIIYAYPFGLLKDTSFFVGEDEFGISHFLGKSDVLGYDIKKVNNLLDTKSLGIVAIAIIIGDDALCYDPKTNEVFLWMIQTGEGEKHHVSDDLTKFLSSFS